MGTLLYAHISNKPCLAVKQGLIRRRWGGAIVNVCVPGGCGHHSRRCGSKSLEEI